MVLGMEPRLSQQQSQKLILSPQIRQYLKLLQLPIAELEQTVEAEISENPLLEEKPQELPQEPPPDIPLERTDAKEIRPGESFESFDAMDENFRESSYPDLARGDAGDIDEKRRFQEASVTRPEALSDFLLWQIRFLEFSEKQKLISQEIIGNIDEDGYLRVTDEEIAQAAKASVPEVQAVVIEVQKLDPAGIAARNLQEALRIQLEKKAAEASDPEANGSSSERLREINLALKIVSSHLPLLEKRDLQGLAKALPADLENVKKAARVIGSLEPRPGRIFLNDDSHIVAPDATINIQEDAGEKYRIEIHDERIPDIRISPYYRRMLRNKNLDEKSKTFLKEKMLSAMNFLKALKLRKSTLREITEEIVKAQPEFLEKGFLHLKPLRLKDIASNLSIHESTVSRAIQGKYVSTPQGMIPYKSFFSSRMENTEGGSESQTSIMEKIRMIIDKEPPKKPYSDEHLVKLLKGEGILIARRTVAKYRDLLKILPSHLRKRKT